MNKEFQVLVESLESKFQALISMPPVRFSTLPRAMPERGIYLFSEGSEHLYIGRTNGIRKRLQGHCRPSGKHSKATLAFRIARHETGRLKASYTKSGSRNELCADPVFGPVFDAAKLRLGTMDIRFVEETDSVRQALLEIYAATVLRTPFNDFDNH
jgi:predicted GIY-YIG superfamily endonuclease